MCKKSWAHSLFALLVLACSGGAPDPDSMEQDSASGGATTSTGGSRVSSGGSGAAPATGGAEGSGGVGPATGGVDSTGGAGTGGANGAGGAMGTGGANGAGGAMGTGGANAALEWLPSWATTIRRTEADNKPTMSLAGNTLRQFVWPTVSGSQIRIQLSNERGNGPAPRPTAWTDASHPYG